MKAPEDTEEETKDNESVVNAKTNLWNVGTLRGDRNVTRTCSRNGREDVVVDIMVQMLEVELQDKDMMVVKEVDEVNYARIKARIAEIDQAAKSVGSAAWRS